MAMPKSYTCQPRRPFSMGGKDGQPISGMEGNILTYWGWNKMYNLSHDKSQCIFLNVPIFIQISQKEMLTKFQLMQRHQWFKKWLATCLTPSHYHYQWWLWSLMPYGTIVWDQKESRLRPWNTYGSRKHLVQHHENFCFLLSVRHYSRYEGHQ